MAASALDVSKIVVGRIKTIDFFDATTPTPLSVFGRLGLKDDVVEIEEIREKIDTTLENGQILRDYSPGRTIQGTITLSELNTADMALIETGKKINIVTATGGTNSTGVTFEIAALVVIKVMLKGLKTVIEFSKTGVTVPYTITSNAA